MFYLNVSGLYFEALYEQTFTNPPTLQLGEPVNNNKYYGNATINLQIFGCFKGLLIFEALYSIMVKYKYKYSNFQHSTF